MDLAQLRDQIVEYFNKSELRNLCQDLNINYENLHGDTLEDKARELVEYCHRRGRGQDLIRQCRELRPHVVWHNIFFNENMTDRTLSEQRRSSDEVKIRLEPVQQPLRSNDKWVSIKVVNEGDDDLVDCYGNLEGYVFVWPDGAETDFNDSARLAWSSNYPSSNEGLITIPRGNQALLDIARTILNQGRFAFTFQRGDDHQVAGKYRIQVRVGGKVQGNSIPPVLFEGYIKYTGGTDLTIY